MKFFSVALASAACILPAVAQANQIVNVQASSSTGTAVTLNAGTYEVNVVGKSGGGAYDGWDFATANYNTQCAKPASNDWVDSFTILANGVSNSYVANGNPTASNAAGALVNYQSDVLYTNSKTAAANTPNAAFFTLNSTQSVDFTVADYFFCDNWGGVSLQLTPVVPTSAAATPEPSTFGLIGLVLVGGAAAVYRRKRATN